MKKLSYFLKTVLTIGTRQQSFIGARWIYQLLRLCPKKYKRKLALAVLSVSPHYFFRDINKDYRKMNYFKFLELEYRRNDESREKILEQLLIPYLEKVNTAIDYGCGPGFLAKYVSRKINQVFAVDISDGVLECARIINPSEKIIYLNAQDIDTAVVNNSIDMVYSFAVIQHVIDVVFEEILRNCFNKLKNGGLILFHIPIAAERWHSEEEWRENKSVYGRVKWKYALKCFSRTEKQVGALLRKHGFGSIQILNIKEMCREYFDDICYQQLVIAKKP